MVSRALQPPLRSAAANSRAAATGGRRPAVPVQDGGDSAVARVRRAPPLPNSVRVSASRRKSATVMCSSGGGSGLRAGERARHTARAIDPRAHVDHGAAGPLPRRAGEEDTREAAGDAERVSTSGGPEAPRVAGEYPGELRAAGYAERGARRSPEVRRGRVRAQGNGSGRGRAGGVDESRSSVEEARHEPSSKTSLIARARSGAIERMVSLSKCRWARWAACR